MPEGTYTMLKPTNGIPFFESTDSGAHYYAYASSGSVTKYKKISGTIILPNSIQLKGTGAGRNAYISLGVTAKNGVRGIDIGLRNRGLDGGGDHGFGWHPYCVELDADIGYYYDGQKNGDFDIMADHKAPSSTKRAKFEIEPNPNGRSVRFSVTWLDVNNRSVGEFNEVISLSTTYQWDNFLRFASLVPWPPTTVNNDSTYMLGGEFLDVKIGSANWGISTGQVSKAWIMHHPKCQLPDGYWDTGEQFRIDHWA